MSLQDSNNCCLNLGELPLSGGEHGKRQDLYVTPKRVHFLIEADSRANDTSQQRDISPQVHIRPIHGLTRKNLALAGKGPEMLPSERPRKQSLQYWRYGIYHAKKSEEAELKLIH